MSRFLAFSGNGYYPNGGIRDFLCDHDSLDDCKLLVWRKLLARPLSLPDEIWVHIADIELMEKYIGEFVLDHNMAVADITWDGPYDVV